MLNRDVCTCDRLSPGAPFRLFRTNGAAETGQPSLWTATLLTSSVVLRDAAETITVASAAGVVPGAVAVAALGTRRRLLAAAQVAQQRVVAEAGPGSGAWLRSAGFQE